MLNEGGVPKEVGRHITGHKQASSLDNYSALTNKQQRVLSNIGGEPHTAGELPSIANTLIATQATTVTSPLDSDTNIYAALELPSTSDSLVVTEAATYASQSGSVTNAHVALELRSTSDTLVVTEAATYASQSGSVTNALVALELPSTSDTLVVTEAATCASQSVSGRSTLMKSHNKRSAYQDNSGFHCPALFPGATIQGGNFNVEIHMQQMPPAKKRRNFVIYSDSDSD